MSIKMHLWVAGCLALSSAFIGCSGDDDDDNTRDEATATAGVSGASAGTSAAPGGAGSTASEAAGTTAAAAAGESGANGGAGGIASVSLGSLTCGSSTCGSIPAVPSVGLTEGIQACCTEAGAANECGVIQDGTCVSKLAIPAGCPAFTQSSGLATPCCLANNACGVDGTAFGQGCLSLDDAKQLLGTFSLLLSGVEATTCDGQPISG